MTVCSPTGAYSRLKVFATNLFINHRFTGVLANWPRALKTLRQSVQKWACPSLYRGTLVVWRGHKDFQDLRVSLENLEVALWWVWLSKDHVSIHAHAIKTRNLQCSIRKTHKTLHQQSAGTVAAVSLSSCLAAATLGPMLLGNPPLHKPESG